MYLCLVDLGPQSFDRSGRKIQMNMFQINVKFPKIRKIQKDDWFQ